MNWKIGDIAIGARTVAGSTGPPVKKGYKYVVANVYVCPACKVVSLDVGFPGEGHGTLCGCRERMPMKEVHWAAEHLFQRTEDSREERSFVTSLSLGEKLEEMKSILNKLVAEEDYLNASKVSKEIEKLERDNSNK